MKQKTRSGFYCIYLFLILSNKRRRWVLSPQHTVDTIRNHIVPPPGKTSARVYLSVLRVRCQGDCPHTCTVFQQHVNDALPWGSHCILISIRLSMFFLLKKYSVDKATTVWSSNFKWIFLITSNTAREKYTWHCFPLFRKTLLWCDVRITFDEYFISWYSFFEGHNSPKNYNYLVLSYLETFLIRIYCGPDRQHMEHHDELVWTWSQTVYWFHIPRHT